ncbi:MAG: hypothetical protein ACO1SV_25635 [Fimbriimonas sp.]
MNATLEAISTVDRALVDSAATYAQIGLGRFLKTLGYVPADRMDLKLAPEAKSPRDLAQHVALAYTWMGPMFLAPLAEDHPILTANPSTDEDLAQHVRTSGEYIVAALRALNSEGLDTVVDTPFGSPMAVRQILLIPGRHLDSHAAQVDFIQTTWGDHENHM